MICVQVEPVFRNRKAITDGVEEVISLKNFTLVSFTVLVLLASSLAHSKTVIKVQMIMGKDSPEYVMANKFATDVLALTGGEVVLKILPKLKTTETKG